MADQDKQWYITRYKQIKPAQPVVKNSLRAFVVGGSICLIGQFIADGFVAMGLEEKQVSTATVLVMVFLGAFLTGIGFYDKLGRYAGAGSIIPVTGFANSIVAPAMEFKREGYILGVGAKMFIIAGPVLVYGMSTAFLIGLLYWLIQGAKP